MNAEEVVRAELEAWSSLDVDQITAHFTPDATWFPAFTFPTYSGIEEIRQAVEGFVKDMTGFDAEIVYLAVTGNVVFTERVDRWSSRGKPREARGVGVFEVAGDKITAWRDYIYVPGT
jgi:limonene-1,2-epoxide hydrolase